LAPSLPQPGQERAFDVVKMAAWLLFINEKVLLRK